MPSLKKLSKKLNLTEDYITFKLPLNFTFISQNEKFINFEILSYNIAIIEN